MTYQTALGELMSLPTELLEYSIKGREMEIERLRLQIQELEKQIEAQQTDIETIEFILAMRAADKE